MKVLLYSLLVVIIDQVTKFLIKGLSIPSLGIDLKGMPYQASKKIIGDLFMLTFIENPGMAFGIQVGGKLFLSLFTIFATLLIVYFIWKNRHESMYVRLALAFILGGAIGNLIDRTFYGVIYGYAPLFYGNVVDFFHVNTPDVTLFGKTFYSWPIFNVADIAVSAGFIMVVFGYNKMFKENQALPVEDEIIVSGDSIIEKHEDEVIITDVDNDVIVRDEEYHEDILNNPEDIKETGPDTDNKDDNTDPAKTSEEDK